MNKNKSIKLITSLIILFTIVFSYFLFINNKNYYFSKCDSLLKESEQIRILEVSQDLTSAELVKLIDQSANEFTRLRDEAIENGCRDITKGGGIKVKIK